jgi:isoleucyl-tRNA synthetase
MELKKTLLMPKTTFEMRGNLPIKEPLMVTHWQDIKLYDQMLASRKGSEEYQLHDGPPYANGDMHIGHLLNRILKDIVVRYKHMQGFYTPFVLGWDTHGLPIENLMTKKGIDRKKMDVATFRQHCHDFALKQVDNQSKQIRRIGVVGDYDNPYLTLHPEYEAEQIKVFANMALSGLIYKGLKPVFWSPSSESALAEAEIIYEDITSQAIYVAFDVVEGKGVLAPGDRLVIWTTTAWTLPGNLGISVHPEFEYGLFDTDVGRIVFLVKLKDAMIDRLHLNKCQLVKKVKGTELEHITTKHPFYDRTSLVMVGDHVSDDTGTGLVHTAPGHGEDDFIIGTKYGLKPLCPVDGHGVMSEEAGPHLQGLFYQKANAVIIDLLKDNKSLLAQEAYVHSYPHDWRTGKPLIYRATDQWFCSIEPIRDRLLQAIEEVKWIPSWGQTRIYNMIKERSDWCISRQRAWGVPIPIIYNEDNTPIIDKDVFNHIAFLIKEHGSNIWFSSEVSKLLPPGYRNSRSPNGNYKKETDIMDVWFDSGSSSHGVLKQRGMKFPSDLYLEGSDQYRGWFNSSLIIGIASSNVSPYKQVVSHGFVVDGKGEKMSKSRGNGIDPLQMADQFGADVLRLWAATVDYQADVRASVDIFKGNSESYRKIRNTFKFMLGNLAKGEEGYYNPITDKVDELELIDTYIMAQLEHTTNAVIKKMDHFDFAGGMMSLLNFISNDLSSFYCDITKDILYCNGINDLRRKQVQHVFYHTVDTLMRLLTPIIPFTMEEVFNSLNTHVVDSSQLLDYPRSTKQYPEQLRQQYFQLLKIRQMVLKELESKRQQGDIGSSQAAIINLTVNDEEMFKRLNNLQKEELARYFVVSRVNITLGKENKATVKVHQGEKCPRCWNYVDELIAVDDVKLCQRCHEVVKIKQ